VGLLAGMVEGGYLVRDEQGRYAIGPRMVSLALRVSARADLAAVARPILASAGRAHRRDGAHRHPRHDSNVSVYIDKSRARTRVRYTVSLGERRELYASAMGKLLLAYMPAASCDAYLKTEKLKAFTPNTITSVRELRGELARIREEEMSRTSSERVRGASALAAPVYGPGGAFHVGMGLAGPSDRMRAHRAAFERELRDAARRLSALLAGIPTRRTRSRTRRTPWPRRPTRNIPSARSSRATRAR
jgi:DNA-binding IclR family transcriptional regulator